MWNVIAITTYDTLSRLYVDVRASLAGGRGCLAECVSTGLLMPLQDTALQMATNIWYVYGDTSD